MYNRYIPQSDGSFQHSRMQERGSPSQGKPPTPPPGPPIAEKPIEVRPCIPTTPYHEEPPALTDPFKIGGFLRQLLPKDFDTEDLLVIILLLLMSKDSKEGSNSALLTLALYLFL